MYDMYGRELNLGDIVIFEGSYYTITEILFYDIELSDDEATILCLPGEVILDV